MARKRYTPEQIIAMLREAEVRLSQGEKTGTICRSLGVSEQSYYRWRREYGGLKVSQARRLKDLEKENQRLHIKVNRDGSFQTKYSYDIALQNEISKIEATIRQQTNLHQDKPPSSVKFPGMKSVKHLMPFKSQADELMAGLS